MAFLTFAEAKVVAPPILPRKYPAHTVQIIRGNTLKCVGILKWANNDE